MLKTDEHLYTLTRLEFAKSIGKSKNAVKLAMMRGKYKDLYIFKNKKYFFKSREAVRENHGLEPISTNPVKRKINRGNHGQPGAYTSSTMKRVPEQFKTHNHLKKMVALRGKLTPEELALIPKLEADAKAERQRQQDERSSSRKDQVGSGDRSERIRTYNFPQGRVTDHRINVTLHKLDKILQGEALDELIDALIVEDRILKLAANE